MHMRSLDDLLMQADYWARQRGDSQVEADDIDEAMLAARTIAKTAYSKSASSMPSGADTLLIDTCGECVGQVNGLSVTELGEHRFGHPVRITATTRVGEGRPRRY